MPAAAVVAAVSAVSVEWVAVDLLIVPTLSFSASAFAGSLAVNLGLSALSGALSDSGRQQSQPTFQAEARDRLQVVRSSVETRRIIYGQAMVSGPLVYAESTGSTHEYVHLVIPLAAHECAEIGDIYLNDEVIGTLDGSGEVTTGRFAGNVRVKKHLGATTQVADADLVAESAGLWTANHRLQGVCYLYVRLKWDRDIFPSGIPNIKAVVKGKLVYDPRVAGSPTSLAWSDNWALCVRDYLTSPYGLACGDAQIDDTTVVAAANIADELVATGTGSPTVYQKRYTCNGTVNLADRPLDIMQALLTAGAGACVYSQGVYRVFAGAYVAPAVDIDESDLRGEIVVQPRRPRRELYNGVRGTFSDPDKFWQPTDFPPVTNSTYEAEDGGQQILRDIELPFTTDSIAAQRIAKIHLEKSRQGITVVLPCKYTVFKLAVWDTVRLSIDRLGWDAKVFQVTSWKFSESGGIDLELQEEAAAVYDWAGGDATVLDPAPDTILPNPFEDLTITGLTASSGTAQLLLQGDGTVVPRIKLAFTEPANAYAKEYELQFARTSVSPTEWRDAPRVAAPASSGFVLPVEDGVAYDCRVRLVTTVGNAGEWAYVYGHTVVGKTEAPSDVTGFTASQSVGSVVFGANTVSDADLDTIEVRLADYGNLVWDDATPLTNILRGQTSTSGAVSPGTWTFLAKAKDTSGNYSSNVASVSLTVTADGFTSISEVEQAPFVYGALTNMVRHWTGVLTPESQSLASALGDELFDEFVPNAYTDCYYETAVIDKGIDAPARVYANIVSALGPGEAGTAAPELEIDSRTTAGSFDGFEVWTIGNVTFRYLKARIHVDTTVGKPVISSFIPTIDAASRTEQGTYTTPGGGSVAVTFATQFHSTPVLQVTPQGSGDVSASYAALDGSGFSGYFKTGGAAAAGTASYSATGA